MQFLAEEAAAVALELHEAVQHHAAKDKETHPGESDVRSRHRRLMEAAKNAAGG